MKQPTDSAIIINTINRMINQLNDVSTLSDPVSSFGFSWSVDLLFFPAVDSETTTKKNPSL